MAFANHYRPTPTPITAADGGVLAEHSGSPLRAYLESHPLAVAPSPLLGLDDSHYQMVFYAGVRGSEPEHAEALEKGILALLNQIADNPISQEVIETILHQIEIDQRHIGGDSMPYGLTLMLEAFSTAVHGGNPLDVWQIDEHLAWLKQQAGEPNWLQNLIRQYLIDNPHRVRLTLSADTKKRLDWLMRKIKHWQRLIPRLVMMINKICSHKPLN